VIIINKIRLVLKKISPNRKVIK